MEYKSAINDLWRVAQQYEYKNTQSYSVVKEYTPTFAKTPANDFVGEKLLSKAEFVQDELVWDGTIYGGNRET